MNKIKLFFIVIIFLYSNGYVYGYTVDIKIKVGNEIITNIDIKNEINYLFFLNPKLKELDKSRTYNIAKESLTNNLVKKKELSKFYDLESDLSLMEEVEKNFLMSKNIKTKNELLNILKNNQVDYATFKDKLKIETFWNKLIYQKYFNNIVINKEELRQNILVQYKKIQKRFAFNLSEIVIEEKLGENINEKIIKINESLQEIGFENTANIYSISDTKQNGGLIGWVNDLQLSDQINRSIKDLKIGDISMPIKLRNGYILIRVNNKKELKQEFNLEDQLNKIIEKETNRQLNSFSMIFFKKLKKNIEINEYR